VTRKQVTQPAKQQAASGPAHYQEHWTELPALEPVEAASSQDGVWLVLADRSGAAASLATRLANEGIKVVQAFAGPEFRQLGAANFECAGDVASFAKLLDLLAPSGIARIVHLWPLDGTDAGVSAETITEAQTLGAEALIALAKAAATVALQVQIITVTRGVAAPLKGFVPAEQSV